MPRSGCGRNGGLLRTDPYGEVVRDEAENVTADSPRRVAIGDRLIVGDQHEDVNTQILPPDAVEQCPEEMSKMKRICRSISREHSKPLRMGLDTPSA